MKKKLRLVGLFIALNIILLTICSSIQAASSVTVRFSHVTTADYNIHGSYSGSDIQTTYSDSGYRTKFRVNGGAEYEVTNGTGSGSNVVCTTTGTPISNGAYIKVNYKLKNNSSSEVTVDLASDADIQIGSNDDAPITKISGNRGFTMSDGKNHMFTFLCRDSYGVSPNVTAFWFGQYGDREKHRWDKSDVSINSLTDGTDSGMIFSWQNQKIPANGEINLSVLFGIGELNEPPTLTVESSFEDHYFVNEEVDIFGRVGDKDTSDTVKIIYAVDDGDEIELAEEYSPNGGEVDYDTKFTIPAGTTPGNHKIQIWARDDNGNMSVPVELHFTVSADNDPPVGEHTIDPDTWTRGDVTIYLTATDALSGMKRIKLPNGGYYSGLSARERAQMSGRIDGSSMSTTYLATDNNTYIFELEDKVGNKANYPVTINNIDRNAPTISVTGNPDTPTTDNITITIVTDDTQSGVKEVYIDGEKLDNTDSNEYTFYKNGTHTIRVVDNVGNENTQEVVIVNKYCECTAGLDHPNYSSDLDGCPICALIEGMEITNETNVYDAQDHRVEYTNPHGAEIVEYYDGGKTLPNDVNTYNYELKVKYNGNEYKTGLTGEYIVTKKIITITGVDATDREYNKSNVVDLTGGELVGVESGDEVNFVLPKTGTSDSEKVGTHNVTVPEITLTGADASNYTLTQPEHTDVDVVISPKHITITGIDATDREYNKSNVVNLTGGELVGVESGDEVNFVLPQTGTSDSEKVGTHNVTVPEITLTGADASNYTLTQPKHTDVDVVISQKHITIEDIVTENREYDKTNVVNVSGGKLVGIEPEDDVTFVLPSTGTIDDVIVGKYNVNLNEITLEGLDASNYILVQPEKETLNVEITRRKVKVEDLHAESKKYDKNKVVKLEGTTLDRKIDGDDVYAIIPENGISENEDVGNWKVNIDEIVLEGADAFNYEIVQPEYGEVMVEIIKPDAPEMNINSYVIEINGEKIENKEEITELPQVRLGDIVKIKIDITNNGIGAGYIENVKVKIPQGLEFIQEDEINIENEWTEEDNNEMLYQTSIYSFDKGVENELATSQSRSLEMVFKVTQEEMIEENLMVCTEVEQTDIRKENRPYNEEYTSNKSDVEIYMAYTDFVANLSVKEIINELTGEEVPLEVAKNLAKFDVPEEELQNEKYKIVYQVNIQNTGKTEGTVDSVVSYLPENVEFLQDENSDWKVISNTNKIVTNETFNIEPGKEEIKEIVVHWSVNNNLESKVNEIMLLSSDDIDQRKIVDIPYEKVEENQIDKEAISKTNNTSKITMFASILEMVNTGDIAVYALIGIALVSTAGIVYISKRKISLSK